MPKMNILPTDKNVNINEIFETVDEKIKRIEDLNKNNFIEKYCKNREFLKKFLKENTHYYNQAIKQKIL